MSTATVRRSAVVTAASCYVSLRLTEQAIRPTVERVWRKLSSDEALDLYAYVIVALHDIAILSGKVAIAAGRDCRRWADAFIESHLEPVAPTEQQPEVAKSAAAIAVSELAIAVEQSTARQRRRSKVVEPVAIEVAAVEAAPKRKRGRPRKNAA